RQHTGVGIIPVEQRAGCVGQKRNALGGNDLDGHPLTYGIRWGVNKSSSSRPPGKPGQAAASARPPYDRGKRRRAVTRVSDLTSLVADKVIRRLGFPQGSDVSRWREIGGPEFARDCLPVKNSFPPGQRRGG